MSMSSTTSTSIRGGIAATTPDDIRRPESNANANAALPTPSRPYFFDPVYLGVYKAPRLWEPGAALLRRWLCGDAKSISSNRVVHAINDFDTSQGATLALADDCFASKLAAACGATSLKVEQQYAKTASACLPLRPLDAKPRSLSTLHIAAAAMAYSACSMNDGTKDLSYGNMLAHTMMRLVELEDGTSLMSVCLFSQRAHAIVAQPVVLLNTLYVTPSGRVLHQQDDTVTNATYPLLEKAFEALNSLCGDQPNLTRDYGGTCLWSARAPEAYPDRTIRRVLTALTGRKTKHVTRGQDPCRLAALLTLAQRRSCPTLASFALPGDTSSITVEDRLLGSFSVCGQTAHGVLSLRVSGPCTNVVLLAHGIYAVGKVIDTHVYLYDPLRSSKDPSWYSEVELSDEAWPIQLQEPNIGARSLVDYLRATATTPAEFWLPRSVFNALAADVWQSTCRPPGALRATLTTANAASVRAACNYAGIDVSRLASTRFRFNRGRLWLEDKDDTSGARLFNWRQDEQNREFVLLAGPAAEASPQEPTPLYYTLRQWVQGDRPNKAPPRGGGLSLDASSG